MRLLDCFIELVAYVSYLLQSVQSQQASFEQVTTDISHLIGKSQDNFRQSSLPPEDFDLARFAVFAWIDEALLNSGWQGKGRWQSEQLQRTYYQTTDAGELFFDRLNQLGPQQNQVREVFYLCLALGFTGRYCNPGDEILLDQLRDSNLKLLGGSAGMSQLENERLFPGAYLAEGEKPVSSGNTGRFSPGLIAAALSPVFLYGVLFFIYRFVLSNVGENFISSVH